MQAPLTPQIDLTQLTAGRIDFDTHYSVDGNLSWAPDIVVGWMDLREVLETRSGVVTENNMALKFIHRYDGTNWFLTMECCELSEKSNDVVATGNRFDLNNGTISYSDFQGDSDPQYFNNVLFDDEAISDETYVSNMIFPWNQLLLMHKQNNLPNDSSIYVKIACCSFNYANYPQYSLVPYPHMVLIYMYAPNHGNYIDDATYTSLYTNRAADFGTLCPPNCNTYVTPPPTHGGPGSNG